MKSYTKGRRFEYEVKDDFEKRDYFCVRSAGSKSLVDLLCISKTGSVLMVQCKRDGKVTKFEEEELKKLAERYHSRAVIATKGDGGKVVYRVLDRMFE